jgi:6-pyruvoyl-tetrahydropterin synthase
MNAVEIRDHVMIAHSLPHEAFGPAQKMHGATYVVDLAFFRERLAETAIVVDIGLASQCLGAVLVQINYSNLDEAPAFAGRLSTTEAVAKWIFDEVSAAIADGRLGEDGRAVQRLRVTLHESHVARAWFEGPVAG